MTMISVNMFIPNPVISMWWGLSGMKEIERGDKHYLYSNHSNDMFGLGATRRKHHPFVAYTIVIYCGNHNTAHHK